LRQKYVSTENGYVKAHSELQDILTTKESEMIVHNMKNA